MSDNEKYPTLRFFVHIAANMGITKVLTDIVKQNTIRRTKADKIMVFVGGIVLASIVVDYAAKHVNEQFDRAVAWWEKQKEEFKNR